MRRSTQQRGEISFELILLSGLVALGVVLGLQTLASDTGEGALTSACRLLQKVGLGAGDCGGGGEVEHADASTLGDLDVHGPHGPHATVEGKGRILTVPETDPERSPNPYALNSAAQTAQPIPETTPPRPGRIAHDPRRGRTDWRRIPRATGPAPGPGVEPSGFVRFGPGLVGLTVGLISWPTPTGGGVQFEDPLGRAYTFHGDTSGTLEVQVDVDGQTRSYQGVPSELDVPGRPGLVPYLAEGYIDLDTGTWLEDPVVVGYQDRWTHQWHSPEEVEEAGDLDPSEMDIRFPDGDWIRFHWGEGGVVTIRTRSGGEEETLHAMVRYPVDGRLEARTRGGELVASMPLGEPTMTLYPDALPEELAERIRSEPGSVWDPELYRDLPPPALAPRPGDQVVEFNGVLYVRNLETGALTPFMTLPTAGPADPNAATMTAGNHNGGWVNGIGNHPDDDPNLEDPLVADRRVEILVYGDHQLAGVHLQYRNPDGTWSVDSEANMLSKEAKGMPAPYFDHWLRRGGVLEEGAPLTHPIEVAGGTLPTFDGGLLTEYPLPGNDDWSVLWVNWANEQRIGFGRDGAETTHTQVNMISADYSRLRAGESLRLQNEFGGPQGMRFTAQTRAETGEAFVASVLVLPTYQVVGWPYFLAQELPPTDAVDFHDLPGDRQGDLLSIYRQMLDHGWRGANPYQSHFRWMSDRFPSAGELSVVQNGGLPTVYWRPDGFVQVRDSFVASAHNQRFATGGMQRTLEPFRERLGDVLGSLLESDTVMFVGPSDGPREDTFLRHYPASLTAVMHPPPNGAESEHRWVETQHPGRIEYRYGRPVEAYGSEDLGPADAIIDLDHFTRSPEPHAVLSTYGEVLEPGDSAFIYLRRDFRFEGYPSQEEGFRAWLEASGFDVEQVPPASHVGNPEGAGYVLTRNNSALRITPLSYRATRPAAFRIGGHPMPTRE